MLFTDSVIIVNHWCNSIDFSVARKLINHKGIIVNKVSTHRTPIDIAVHSDHIEIVASIIGANQSIDFSKKIVVHALRSGSVKCVSFLLDKYILRVNSRLECLHHQTPLQYVSCYGQLEVVRLLLAAGGDKHLRDSRYWNALDWAVSNSYR